LEVADIFRRHGPAYVQAHDGHLGRVERRVMSAIELCRTAALGGHVEGCRACGTVHVAYNSCLMGRSGNGELAATRSSFASSAANPTLHYEGRLRSAMSLSDGSNVPRRKCGGTIDSIASSFSVGSPRV
jgi:hypothetical protein